VPSLAKPALIAAALTLALTSAASAQTQPPNFPNLPDIPQPPGLKTVRFKMTIHGSQYSYFAFSFTLEPSNPCRLHAEGQISEDWEFARGQGVILEFSKLPNGFVTLKRHGRNLGDAAVAAPGGLKREANGFADAGECGGAQNFADEPTCGEEFEVNSDLRLQYLKGKLILERGGTRRFENPAAKCGETGGAIDLFTWPYPLLAKQKADFTKKQIFGKKRGFHLALKDHFIAPLREPVYESVSEKLTGESDVTLQRLKTN
jgi:hypothetical protein